MQTKLLINGKLVAGEGKVQNVLNPATGKVLARVPEASRAQIDAAVKAAIASRNSCTGAAGAAGTCTRAMSPATRGSSAARWMAARMRG